MEKPNILWLMGDHFAFKHHVDLYSQLQLKTYNRLAAEGVVFDQAYSVCPLCQPARSSMLTGVFPHRHGILINDEESGKSYSFAPDQKFINHFLEKAGYRNVYFGKWHCGYDKIPADYGFEGWSLPGYGYPYVTERYSKYLEEKGLPHPKVLLEWDIRNPENEGRTFDLFGPWVAAGKLTGPLETHESSFVADMVCRWLNDNSADDRPFFMQVNVWGPHHPYHSAGDFIDSVDSESLAEYPGFGESLGKRPGNYEACRKKWECKDRDRSWKKWQKVLGRCYEQVMIVDNALGQVVSTLDKLGMGENTLVIYTADHGDMIASQGGLMNKDAIMLEETMRVPMALRWPKGFEGGKISRALVSNMDLAATVLDAGKANGDFMAADSESLLPLCRNPEAKGREVLVSECHGEARVEFFQRMLRWKNYKYIAHLDDIDELYNLEKDPFELSNAVEDPQYQDILKQARVLLIEEMNKSCDSSPDAEKLKNQLRAR